LVETSEAAVAEQTAVAGPDLARGVPASQLADGEMLAGHVGNDAVLLARVGGDYFAIGATCTHYGGPLAEGLLVGDTVRCPWHHACFNLRTGDAVRAPALRPQPRWEVERRGDLVVVGRKIEPPDPDLGGSLGSFRAPTHSRREPESVVIVGAGAAGAAAAEVLRREGYAGPITIVDGDRDAPYDRPNLSKDYLAGNAPEEWIPLRPHEFYRDHRIDLRLGVRAARLDVDALGLVLQDGSALPYGALLIATGSSPMRLPSSVDVPGRVRYLRSLADSRAIIADTSEAKRVVVIGASFIGLETAASLRARGLDVHVVAPEHQPLARVLGPEIGGLVRGLHEARGVAFHLGRTVKSIDERTVTLDDGAVLEADVVVAGIGVRPDLSLASSAGLVTNSRVEVNEYLETRAPGVFAAGDIAYWPDPHTGERIHVEHWVVAERQGQTAARNILGAAERFDDVPFFWSQHYDAAIAYVGHAERWDRIDIDGDLASRDWLAAFRLGDRTLAVATMGRDLASLRAEVSMERGGATKTMAMT
jgi:apoptosis-inducing factor 3